MVPGLMEGAGQPPGHGRGGAAAGVPLIKRGPDVGEGVELAGVPLPEIVDGSGVAAPAGELPHPQQIQLQAAHRQIVVPEGPGQGKGGLLVRRLQRPGQAERRGQALEQGGVPVGGGPAEIGGVLPVEGPQGPLQLRELGGVAQRGHPLHRLAHAWGHPAQAGGQLGGQGLLDRPAHAPGRLQVQRRPGGLGRLQEGWVGDALF